MQTIVLALVLAWYISNTLSSYYTKLVFCVSERGPNEELFFPLLSLSLVVTFLQLATAGISGKLYHSLLTTGQQSPWSYYQMKRLSDPPKTKRLMIIAGCNAMGTLCTNVGYIYGSVSLVQLIKSMEPVATFICDALVFKTASNRTTMLGVLLVIFGSCFASFKDSSFNFLSVGAALLSNTVLPVRNVLTKFTVSSMEKSDGPQIPTSSMEKSVPDGGPQIPTNEPRGFLLFAFISSLGAVYVGFLAVLSMTLFSVTPLSNITTEAIISSVTYTAYNSFSFLVLSHMDPVMHAILNVFKRAFNIVTSMYFFGQPFSQQFMIGLLIAMFGLVVYLVGKKNIDAKTLLYRKKNTALFMAILALIFVGVADTSTSGSYKTWGFEKTTVLPLPRDPPELMTEISASFRPLSDLAPRDLGDLAFVPLEAYNTCEDRVLHLSCLRTIMASSEGSLQKSPTFLPSICDQILLLSQSLNEDGQLYEGHVNLCLQVGSTVGVVVKVSDGRLKGQVLTSDVNSVTNVLGKSGSFVKKIVDRVTIANHAMYLPKSRKNDEVRRGDGNLGNFLWQYGATRMVNPFTTLIYVDTVLTGDIEENSASAGAYLLPSANAFNLEKYGALREHVSDLRQRVVQLDVPTVIIGIGIQAKFNDIEDISKIALFDFHVDFLKEVVARQRSPSIAVRGDFTETACKNAHINNCVSMGCPSLTISHDLNLGKTMKTRWDATMKKIHKGEKLQKLIITLPAMQPAQSPEEYDGFVTMFLHLYQYHEVYFVEQMGYDKSNFVNYKKQSTMIVKPERWKRFDNVEDWLTFLSDADLVVSTRIHGGMAGIASGTPTFVIPTDFRIMELVNAMAIPYLSMEKATLPFESLSKTVSLVEKDFGLFERNRRIKIYEYVRILGEIGVEIDPALLEVLNAPL